MATKRGVKKHAARKRPAAKKIAAKKIAAKKPKRAAPLRVGSVVWHDLLTANPVAACDFYRGLFGWEIDEQKMGGATVFLLKKKGIAFGAVMSERALPQSHWMPYVATKDVAVTCKRVVSLGGRVCLGAMNVAKLGRFAVLADRQGGVFSVITRPAGSKKGGDFAWDELLTPTPEDAAKFYSDLFAWDVEQTSVPQIYWRAKNGKDGVAGIMRPPSIGEPRPSWFPYVAVKDVDEAARRAVMLGATVFVAPRDVPDGRLCVLGDPVGAVFAVWRLHG